VGGKLACSSGRSSAVQSACRAAPTSTRMRARSGPSSSGRGRRTITFASTSPSEGALAAEATSESDVVADARANFRLLIGEVDGGKAVPKFMRDTYFGTLSSEIRVALGEEEIMIAAQKGARALAEAKQKQAEIERAVTSLKNVVLLDMTREDLDESDFEALVRANDVLKRIIVARGGTAADGSTDAEKLGGADDNEVSSLLLDGMNLSGEDKKMATSFLEGAGVQAVNSAFFGTMAGAGLILVYVLLNAGK